MNFPIRTSLAPMRATAALPPAAHGRACTGTASRIGTLLASIACGTALGLGCAALVPGWVAVLALVAVALQVQQSLMDMSGRRVLATSLPLALAMLAMQLAGGWWLALGLNPRGDAWAWQTLAVAMTTLVQTTWFVAAWLLARAGARTWPGRLAGIGMAAAWCLAWGASESLRELGAVGDGYTVLGTSFLDLPGFSGWPALIGTHGVSMLVAGLAWLLASAIRALTTRAISRLEAGRIAAAAALAVMAAIGAGSLLSPVEWTRPEGTAIDLTIVQDATDKRRPWSAAERDSAEDRLLAAVRSTPRGGVVVTPEGHFADPLPTRPEAFWQTLRDEVSDRGIHVLVGMPQRALEGDERQVFNAIVQVAPDRFALYAKERLVPGGESLPMASLFSALYDNAFQGRADAPRTGEHAAPPELTQSLFVAGVSVGASICHELSFTTTIAQRARGSAWLVNAADDAWIPSAIYRSQMAVIARARALEFAKPLLRVSDGGSSMLVDAGGRLAQSAPTNEVATLHWRVQPRNGSTPYERHAQALALAPVAALAVLFFAGLAMRAGRLFPDAPLP